MKTITKLSTRLITPTFTRPPSLLHCPLSCTIQPRISSPIILPRSFHSSPALFALLRSSASKKREDALSIALQDSKNKKLTSEKVSALMQYPDLKAEQAMKIFDLAAKHNIVTTQVVGAILEFLYAQKKPELVDNIHTVWKVATEKDVPPSVAICEVMYETYAEAGETDKMWGIVEKVEKLKQPNPRFYNPLVELFMIRGQRDKAFAIIEKLKERGGKPDSLTYQQLLEKFLDDKKDTEIFIDTYKKMRADAVRPSGVTIFFMIEAYGKAGMYDKAMEMFDIGKGMGLRMTVNPYISAIRYMGKAGMVKRAEHTFDLMRTDGQAQGPVSYHTLIEVYATNNLIPDALKTLEKMRKEGYKPAIGTFMLILDVLLPGSDVTSMGVVVESMKSCKVKPDEPLLQRFAEFEARNNLPQYWPPSAEPNKPTK